MRLTRTRRLLGVSSLDKERERRRMERERKKIWEKEIAREKEEKDISDKKISFYKAARKGNP